MKKTLSFKEIIAVASLLFGMFFGAGNLIYPIVVGQMAGQNMWIAAIGFLISAVGFPILAVAALGTSRSEGLFDLSKKVGKPYAYFFTCALYLTIGPLFAIPRCATVPFEVGVKPLVGEENTAIALAVYSVVFFALVLFFSLRPGKILTTIGKVLSPLFLLFLGALVITTFIKPMADVSEIAASGDYINGSFLAGFFKGYDTLDALAGLAFGIIVINVIRQHKIEASADIAKNTVLAGIFSGIIMIIIYVAIIFVGAQSMGITDTLSANGGEAFALVSQHYFGTPGMIVIAAIFFLACLKTAIGLVTSCSETFKDMFPKGPSYKAWAVIFSVVALLIANLGLSAIITYSAPLLYFLYPLAITLILLAMFSKQIGSHKEIYVCVTVGTLIAAVFDFARIFGAGLQPVADLGSKILPLFDLGLGFLCPAAIGLVVGLVIAFFRKKA